MTRALALLLVLLSVSCLEGLWVWLLAASLSEFDTQVAPSLPALALVAFIGWLTARALSLSRMSLAHRRTALVGGGLGLALLAATTHAGLIVPLQLVLGPYDPDYRGSGVALGLLVAYLWARGLALAARVNRRQIVSHVVVSTFILTNILFILPLAGPVQDSGLGVVVGSFFAALIAMLLVQTADTESRELTKAQWFALTGATGGVIVLTAGLFTGVLANGLPLSIGEAFGRLARAATPVTNAILLGIGYVAHYLTLFVLFLKAVHGGDPDAVSRSQQEAEQSRFRFQNDDSYGPPEIMTLFAMLILVGLAVWFLAHVISRLVQQGERRARAGVDIERVSLRESDLLDSLRDALGRIPGLGALSDGLLGRGAEIRRHYRAFQSLMAQAQMPRDAAQTAGEYQHQLAAQLPRAAVPITTISDTYTLARYGGPDTPLPDAHTMASALRDIRSVLQAEEAGERP